ncbi:MAG: CHAT domain-containing protein [Spirulina sp. SIO3F2]|nr:CHAT domain-containing protein [Spirulina sp. SIO3F2]
MSLGNGSVLAQDLTPTKLDPSEMNKVLQMELGLEAEFEDHFRENLATVTQTPNDIARTLRELNTATGTNAAVLWAIPEEDFLHLVLVTPDGETLVLDRTDVTKSTLKRTVRRFRRGLHNTQTNQILAPAQQLYDWIVSPFEQDYLQAKGVDKILFCLGDGLRGVPMAALHDGEQFMVEKYSTTMIPAFNLIQTDYQPHLNRDILAMGASEFRELSPLPAVPAELASIQAAVDQLPQGEQNFEWQVESLLNQEFTVDNLDELLDDESFDIVHLATHASFSAGHPRESYIQFKGERLSLHKMDKLHWNEPPIDLLVLSACQTALGSSEAELGFAGMALKAGVKSAIASLWSVSDAGTLALMTEFYRQLPTAPTKATALRNAQLQMLRGEVEFTDTTLRLPSGEVPLTEELHGLTPEDLSHPFYWASFTMLSHPW